MKCSERWLRQWINPPITQRTLCQQLTQSGFEVSHPTPISSAVFYNVVVGQIIELTLHQHTKKALHICTVSINNQKKPLIIVCGGKNLYQGMKVATALPGAVLPGERLIEPVQIEGVLSNGMLCSLEELGIEGYTIPPYSILELPQDAIIGTDCFEYLQLADHSLEISITPNRGDCLSIKGMAREIAAITQEQLTLPYAKNKTPIARPDAILNIQIDASLACPHYTARVIHDINPNITTPIWLSERLRRSGVRPTINFPIVDIANYVMFELGQPLHTFDLSFIQKSIIVRYAKDQETLILLDHRQEILNKDILIIADDEKPLAIAGIMGGLASGITSKTTSILIESAYFSPDIIAKQRQTLNISSEAAYRFERGVDPTMQEMALERATQLILSIMGGDAGPILAKTEATHLPKTPPITLTSKQVSAYLGMTIKNEAIGHIFNQLQFNFSYSEENKRFLVEIPSYRFDIKQPEDLIEEIIRLYGYDHIPSTVPMLPLHVPKTDQTMLLHDAMCRVLATQGYHEIISYSFVSPAIQALLDPEQKPRPLLNPLTTEMSVMRTTLWGSLLTTLLNNLHHQPQQIRLFEIAQCFIPYSLQTDVSSKTNDMIHQPSSYRESMRLAGLAAGYAMPIQWGQSTRQLDFYDVKGHVSNLLRLLHVQEDHIRFEPSTHPALHPGQTAQIYYNEHAIAMIGAVHPRVLQRMDLANMNIYLFELYLSELSSLGFPKSVVHAAKNMINFPEIRRDIALLVNPAIPAQAIQDTIKRTAGSLLREVFVFDIYQGTEIDATLKSIALTLFFQHPERTLVDEEIAILMDQILATLKNVLGATLRS